jgi:hypothetical protein
LRQLKLQHQHESKRRKVLKMQDHVRCISTCFIYNN